MICTHPESIFNWILISQLWDKMLESNMLYILLVIVGIDRLTSITFASTSGCWVWSKAFFLVTAINQFTQFAYHWNRKFEGIKDGFFFHLTTSDDHQIRSFVVIFFQSILSYYNNRRKNSKKNGRCSRFELSPCCLLYGKYTPIKGNFDRLFSKKRKKNRTDAAQARIIKTNYIRSILSRRTSKYGTTFGTGAFEKRSKKVLDGENEKGEKKIGEILLQRKFTQDDRLLWFVLLLATSFYTKYLNR